MKVEKIVSVFVIALLIAVLTSEAGAAQKLDLKLRLKPGRKYGVRITTEDRITQTIMARQQDISYTRAMGLEFDVEQVDANGIASVKVTYRTLREKTSSWAGSMEYDSTKPASTFAANPLAPTYAAMMGQSFVMKVAPRGTIVEVSGIEQMFEEMAEKIVAAEDELISKNRKTKECKKTEGRKDSGPAEPKAKKAADQREQRKETVKNMIKKHPLFSESQIRGMLGNLLISFPPGPVAVGDSWQDKVILAPMFPVEADSTHTLKKTKKGVLVVDVVSKIGPDDKGVPVSSGSAKMQGSYQQSYELDQASCWLIRSKVNTQLSGQVTVGATTVPTSIERTVTVEPMKLE